MFSLPITFINLETLRHLHMVFTLLCFLLKNSYAIRVVHYYSLKLSFLIYFHSPSEFEVLGLCSLCRLCDSLLQHFLSSCSNELLGDMVSLFSFYEYHQCLQVVKGGKDGKRKWITNQAEREEIRITWVTCSFETASLEVTIETWQGRQYFFGESFSLAKWDVREKE